MSLGQIVRRLAGPLEPMLVRAYRAMFFDIDAFARRVAGMANVRTVIEIGCGEGALISALSKRLQQATFVGIDIGAHVGRMFEGDRERVAFFRRPAQELAAEKAGWADVVILCDVMHHVPPPQREGIWRAAAALAKPGGRIVVKEWVKSAAPIFWLGWAGDRYVTGDRITSQTSAEWTAAIARCLPDWEIEEELYVRPWRTNHGFVLRRRAPVAALGMAG